MPDGAEALTIDVIDNLSEVPAADWDRAAGEDNPFVSHAFLSALERSNSVGPRTGWHPQHVIARQGARLVGAVPLYLKTHSYGEYVFDHGWADAFERAGGRYYPKLQAAVPFSPVPGPRLLVAPDAPPGTRDGLARGLVALTDQTGVSSLHVTFAGEEDMAALEGAGFLRRTGYQFHWINNGYTDFEAFLADLSSRKRKTLRKERRDANAEGITLHTLSGDAIEKRHWDVFFRCYMSTSDRKWGSAYLTRSFFDELGATLADKIVLVMAEDRGKLVAGALNLRGRDALYGRNWGVLGDYPMLHFETCYYRAIDYAIEHKLARVEAGAQGEHKLQRGYLPTPTWSAHYIRHSGLASAVADFLARERRGVEHQIAELMEHSPFRQEG